MLALIVTTVLADFPCAGCTTIVPPHPTAILAVLHGDDGGASETLADWRAAADDAGVVLVALQTPGKSGSWWRWLLSPAHDPAWLSARLDEVTRQKQVGSLPILVAGYSGGGSYLAWWVPEHPDVARAVAFVSGGYPFGTHCPAHAPPILFTSGDADESLPGYIEPTRAWWQACGIEPTWRLVPKITHAGMHDALRKSEAARVISWLLQANARIE